jgi:hypothetical protein
MDVGNVNLASDANACRALRRFLSQVLQEADVVVTTLAGAASLTSPRLYPVLKTSLVTAAKANARRGESQAGAAGPTGGNSVPPAQLTAALRFDALVVDEAGQSTEPEVLTPLRHAFTGHVLSVSGTSNALAAAKPASGAALTQVLPIPPLQSGGAWTSLQPWTARSACVRLVLVGDPLQLPATVLARSAAVAGLDVSLFERLAGSGVAPLLLRTQVCGAQSGYSERYDITVFSVFHPFVFFVLRAVSYALTDFCIQ